MVICNILCLRPSSHTWVAQLHRSANHSNLALELIILLRPHDLTVGDLWNL